MPIITVGRVGKSAAISQTFKSRPRVCVIIKDDEIMDVIQKLHAVIRLNAADAAIKAAEQQASGEV